MAKTDLTIENFIENFLERMKNNHPTWVEELNSLDELTANVDSTDEKDFFETEDEGKIKPLDNVDEIKVGDYIYIDGESSFCYGSYQKITKIETRYNEFTGKPYKVFKDEDNNLWSAETGLCISGGLRAYSIYGYGRKCRSY